MASRGASARRRFRQRAAALSLALGLCPGLLVAATYKWVDEKGSVHYSDKVPPDAVNRSSVMLNKEGVQTKRIDAAPTQEQLRAQELEAERRQAVTRQQEEIARRDRALLGSYSTEAEIDLARNRALGTLEAVIKSATSYREQLVKRKAELDAKIAAYQGKPLPPVFERDSENLKQELARQAELVEAKRKEIEAVSARYDGDKARWRELSAAKAKANPAATSQAASASAAPPSLADSPGTPPAPRAAAPAR